MGAVNKESNDAAQAKRWYAEARQWYEKAIAGAKDPKARSATRRSLVQFLGRTDPDGAEKELQGMILKRGAGADDAGTASWAKLTLALIYANAGRPAEALALLDEAGEPGGSEDPDEKRVRARVLEAQRTPEYRREAIKVLESLVAEKRDKPEDLQLLARIAEAAGDWPKSREYYRMLAARKLSTTDEYGYRTSSPRGSFKTANPRRTGTRTSPRPRSRSRISNGSSPARWHP